MLKVVSMLVVFLTALLPPDTIPPSLAKMADTERAFAKRAAEVGVRDSFLEYFADESVSFEPDPGPARERLKQRPAPPAGAPRGKLLWEPRFGDVAASGDLGYLTGPVEQVSPTGKVAYFNYFSVWKKQANGEYRVILDTGVDQPAKPAFAAGLTRSPAASTYKGGDTKAAAEASLLAADKAFSAAIAKDPAAAYAATMHPAGRFHRGGTPSITSSADAVKWLKQQVKSMTSEPLKSETAASRDLGYTWGKFTENALAGYYLRLWTRKADGTWQVVADITEPAR